MRRGERGAAALEFVIVLPVLVMLIALVVAAGRLALTRIAVQQWADSAARTATLARDAATASSASRAVVAGDAAQSGVRCQGGWNLVVDASAFSLPVGQPGTVVARASCAVGLSDLIVPGLPGVILIEASSSSVLDRYRGRR